MSKERKHLHRLLNAKGFISSATAPVKGNTQREQVWTPRATITIPYVAGVSEEIRRIGRSCGIRVAFKTTRTICSELTKVKDPLPVEKQSMLMWTSIHWQDHSVTGIETERTQRCLQSRTAGKVSHS